LTGAQAGRQHLGGEGKIGDQTLTSSARFDRLASAGERHDGRGHGSADDETEHAADSDGACGAARRRLPPDACTPRPLRLVLIRMIGPVPGRISPRFGAEPQQPVAGLARGRPGQHRGRDQDHGEYCSDADLPSPDRLFFARAFAQRCPPRCVANPQRTATRVPRPTRAAMW